jgi:ketosteroid isomerase-like protein
MKRFLILFSLSILAVVGLTTYLVKTASADANAKDEILKISDEREEALAKGDVAALDRIDADDQVYTNWRGVTLTKAEHLADIKARNLTFPTSFKHNDVQVVVHGNTGIVTGLSKTNVVYKGNTPSGSRKFVNVFLKENGKWLCVVHFEAPVAQ